MNSAEGSDLKIIGEGAGWVAIDKPSGMSTHNEGGADSVDALTALTRLLNGKPGALSPVHRLDKETSGVLLFATSRESASRLQTALSEDEKTQKLYRAILRGKLEGSGTWDFPISDKAEGRENPAGKSADRKQALTRYEVVRASDFLSDVKLEILTGRQHQIRKHSRLAKHGIVGDTRYGEMSHARKMASIYGVSRMMLHAERLHLLDLDLLAPLPPEFDLFFADRSNRIPT